MTRVSHEDERIADLGRQVLAGRQLNREEIRVLVELGAARPHELLYWAHRVRTLHFGRAVALCAIVPGKLGGCAEDCKWCAQSVSGGQALVPPRLTSLKDILAAAAQACTNRASSLGIVNSGRSPSDRELQTVIQSAKVLQADSDLSLRICASLGELTPDQADELVSAGVFRYNHNLETSRRFFPRVVSTHTFDDRLATLTAARQAGLSLCSGGIFGLGETWDDRIDLALTLRDIVLPDVVPLNFLHPIPGTPLADNLPLPPLEVLSIISVFRIILPSVDLKIAGGRETNLRDLQSWMFYAGATSCLVGNYLTTCGRGADDDLRMIADLGLTVVPELPVSVPLNG